MFRARTRAWRGVSAVAVLAAVSVSACSEESPPSFAPVNSPPQSIQHGSCGAPAGPLFHFTVRFGCNNRKIGIPTTGPLSGPLWAAATEWNSAFPEGLGLPRFQQGLTGATFSVSMDVNTATSGNVHGETYGLGSNAMTVKLFTDEAVTGAGAVGPILLHELNHVVGFENPWWEGQNQDSMMSGHCARGPNGPFRSYVRTTICQHEIEYVLYAYGIRLTEPHMDRHIITDFNLNPILMTPNSQQSFTVTRLAANKGNPSICINVDDCGVTPGPNDLAWASSNSSVFTVSSTGLSPIVTAGSTPGTAYLRASLASNVYDVATFVHDSVLVTVATCTSISLNPSGPQTLYPGTSVDITASPSCLAPINPDTMLVSWSSVDPAKVTATATGTKGHIGHLVGVAVGSTTVKACVGAICSSNMSVTVNNPPTPVLTTVVTSPNSPPKQYTPFNLTINGSSFVPSSVEVVYSQSCGGCSAVWTNSQITTKTATQLVLTNRVFSIPGPIWIQVRNGPAGAPISVVAMITLVPYP